MNYTDKNLRSYTSISSGRQFGAFTDDSAIFIEDTIDRATARCISVSPSAVSFLSPQQLSNPPHPPNTSEQDVWDPADPNTTPTAEAQATKSLPGPSEAAVGNGALDDASDSCAVKLGFNTSPTPPKAGTNACGASPISLLQGTPKPLHKSSIVSMPEAMVPLREFERVEKECGRYQKMYEHQKMLYEEIVDKHGDTYRALQEKIIHVVALSSRNEECKKFIQQLKKEKTESRTRVIDIQNEILEKSRAEREAKKRYEALIEDQARKYEQMTERNENALIALESLVQDLNCTKMEEGKLHVAQLDSLLKSAYTKNTSLMRDLLRQRDQIDFLSWSKQNLEQQVDQLRREKREIEKTLLEERRRLTNETERLAEQIEEQQQAILHLRQTLARTMDPVSQDASPHRKRHSPCSPRVGLSLENKKSESHVSSTLEAVGSTTAASLEFANISSRFVASGSAASGNDYRSADHTVLENLFSPPSVNMERVRWKMAAKKELAPAHSSTSTAIDPVISEEDNEPLIAATCPASLKPYEIEDPPKVSALRSTPSNIPFVGKGKPPIEHARSAKTGIYRSILESKLPNRRPSTESGDDREKENVRRLGNDIKHPASSRASNSRSKQDAKLDCARLPSRAALRFSTQRQNRSTQGRNAESETRAISSFLT